MLALKGVKPNCHVSCAPLRCTVALNAPYFIILICLTPDYFTHDPEHSKKQNVFTVYKHEYNHAFYS